WSRTRHCGGFGTRKRLGGVAGGGRLGLQVVLAGEDHEVAVDLDGLGHRFAHVDAGHGRLGAHGPVDTTGVGRTVVGQRIHDDGIDGGVVGGLDVLHIAAGADVLDSDVRGAVELG